MKNNLLYLFLFGVTVGLLLDIQSRLPERPKEVVAPCNGWTLIEAGKALDCNGRDTIPLERDSVTGIWKRKQ